jgi:hypothetical protein
MVFEHQASTPRGRPRSHRWRIVQHVRRVRPPRRTMQELPECVDGLPNLCGSEQQILGAVAAGRARPVFDGQTPVDISGVDSAFAVALHMHQPLIPAGLRWCRPVVGWGRGRGGRGWLAGRPGLAVGPSRWVGRRRRRARGENWPWRPPSNGVASRRPARGLAGHVAGEVAAGWCVGWSAGCRGCDRRFVAWSGPAR